MITDTEIREQGYIYFLEEAPELIQTIEQELFSLAADYSTATVHNLMRATHTIKGGAATVGLKAIQMIAHSLEDVFKALYSPNVFIDDELQNLILSGYECLKLALTAELTNTTINETEVINRAGKIFAQLQAKLGDDFGNDNHIPTSEELGFDIVKSIFEVGVQQRLESIVDAIENIKEPIELKDFLLTQIEVFLGLAASLNLPGWGEIAQSIADALTANPHQAKQIAKVAIADLQQAQKEVLAGDRICGGTPSTALKQFTSTVKSEPITTSNSQLSTALEEFYHFLTTPGNHQNESIQPATAKFYLKVVRCIFGWFNHVRDIPESELNWNLLISNDQFAHPIKYIQNWQTDFLQFVSDTTDSKGLHIYRQGILLITTLAVIKFEYANSKSSSLLPLIQALQKKICLVAKQYKQYPPVTAVEKDWTDKPKLEKLLVLKQIVPPIAYDNENALEAIWGGTVVEDIAKETISREDELEINNHQATSTSLTVSEKTSTDIAETAIDVVNQQIIDKHQAIQQKKQQKVSSIRVDVEGLERINYLASELLISFKRRTLNDEQTQEIIEKFFHTLNKHQETLNQLRDLPLHKQSLAIQHSQNIASVKFDPLEMDAYTEFNLTLHEAIEETSQLLEATESIDILLRQGIEISNQKQNLGFSLIDNLVQARMLPLENILKPFPQMVKNLNKVYHKSVQLKFNGTDVLVDKAIAEKLYDPLLHLIRNAFDHGIESPQVRRERGKPEQGLIEISAYHQGSQTVIEVRDDGQGINIDHIRRKAAELNFIPSNYESANYLSSTDESELLEFMFAPGFSTAEKVSELSGRGMGLDIVRSQLQALNGYISVQTLPNQGTKFILKIPFSMTTDKLMLVQAGGFIYALLLQSIEKIVIPTAQQIKEFEGKQVLHYDAGDDNDNMVSLHQLTELMDYHSTLFKNIHINNLLPDHQLETIAHPVLLLKRNQGLFALQVDQIIGEQELVIRPLGNAIAPPKYVYGCSSLANGNLILVIDGTLLLESIEMQATLDVSLLPKAEVATQKSLPKTETNHQPLLAASQPPKSPEINPKSSQIILVVDDAISLRQTLSLTLQKAGYKVMQAQNGTEALEQLQRHPEIHLVLSDLEMPHMNGFELLTNMRHKSHLKQVPVVILTSRSAEKHRQLAQELGAKAYLTKPYLEHELINTVESIISANNQLLPA